MVKSMSITRLNNRIPQEIDKECMAQDIGKVVVVIMT